MFALGLALVASVTQPVQLGPIKCVGLPLRQCLGSIRQFYKFDDEEVEKNVSALDEVDVNGKPTKSNRTLYLYYWKLSRFEDRSATISLDPDNIVTGLRLNLQQSPSISKTVQDYQQTGLHDAMATLVDSSCWGDKELILYQWFENEVKPKIRDYPRDRKFGVVGASEIYSSRSLPVELCGHHFVYFSMVGYQRQAINVNNPSGAIGSFTIEMVD